MIAKSQCSTIAAAGIAGFDVTTYNLPPDPSKAHKIIGGPIWAEVKALTAEARRLKKEAMK